MHDTRLDEIEFHLTFNQSGIEVTLGVKVLAETFAGFAEFGEGREELLKILSDRAIPEFAVLGCSPLLTFHDSVELAFRKALSDVIVSRVASQ